MAAGGNSKLGKIVKRVRCVYHPYFDYTQYIRYLFRNPNGRASVASVHVCSVQRVGPLPHLISYCNLSRRCTLAL